MRRGSWAVVALALLGQCLSPGRRHRTGNHDRPNAIATESGYELLCAGFWREKTRPKEKYAWLGATSQDGIDWPRYEANPVAELTGENGWLCMSSLKAHDTYLVYYAIGAGSDGIGVIKGTIAER